MQVRDVADTVRAKVDHRQLGLNTNKKRTSDAALQEEDDDEEEDDDAYQLVNVFQLLDAIVAQVEFFQRSGRVESFNRQKNINIIGCNH